MERAAESSYGFNLIELVITIAIVAILGSIAIPSYINYNRRAYFSDILQVVTPYKVAVTSCYQNTKKLTGCSANAHKIPANITTAKDDIASLKVVNGIITVIPVKKYGVVAEDTYTLTPSVSNKTLVWLPSGGAITKGYVDNP